MARGGGEFIRGKGGALAFGVVATGAGMGMDGGAVAGDSEGAGRDNAVLQGRDDGGMIKKLLESGFKVKEDVLTIQKPLHDLFRDFSGRFQ